MSKELSDWTFAPFEQSSKFPEQLVHKSPSGHFVRSKSEAMIDTLLYLKKLPFRYECALHLDNVTLYPDFTIRHPKSGKTFYWEHFGLMDDPNYSKNAYFKLQTYTSHGIIPSIHLITTYETKEHPLTSDFIEKILQYYFL